MRRAGLLAPELLALDVFQRVAFGQVARAPLALALVHAWDNRDNDPAAWSAAVRAARAALK